LDNFIIVVFLKDLGQIVGIILQFLFWLTPIFWSFNILPARFQFIFKLNPVYYLVEGYRDAFIYHVGFWQYPNLALYFWSETIIIFIVGAVIFKKLRPHFADVL
jgi:ABC-type polysaccharide/polyol phosphate export permease